MASPAPQLEPAHDGTPSRTPAPPRRASGAGRIAVGVLLAALLAVGVMHWLDVRRSASRSQGAEAEATIVVARAAADVAAKLGGEGEGIAPAMTAWAQSQPSVKAYRVINIDSRSLEASTFPADQQEGAPPRRLARPEKPLYDLGQTLRTNVETNAEEQTTGNPEFTVERQASGDVLVAAPFKVDGAVTGFAQILATPVAPKSTAPPLWRALAFIAAPFLVVLGLTFFVRNNTILFIAGLVLLLATIWLHATEKGASYGLATAAVLLFVFVGGGYAGRTSSALLEHRQAYWYIAPAIIGMLLLVFFPFFYGIILSFTRQNIYTANQPLTELWIGAKNYVDIITDVNIFRNTPAGRQINYGNFYWTLFFTILWTVANVAIGVAVGLVLALVLNTKNLRFKALYRVLLILPWAVPNYITALIWKGMFHQQFGVINQVIQIFGGDPISWFEKPATSFAAVVTTNGWLSFPFMMVVSLGALQSIPGDLYEAARVDGATRWQQFRSITLPSLKPALIPAIILSVVWTFNMFNIIYLVSAGEPAGSTEILITQAYKIAFEQYRYGYAAAYSTVIFAILLIYGIFQNRATRATESIA
ncbi:MAG TPA: sugar ABC transporter permease [Thermoanaerobaculia bacterium]